MDHEIWNHLEENDVLGVEVVAQFPGWDNYAESARLQFWDKIDPVPFLSISTGPTPATPS
jgi:hypothetical protein